MKSGNEAVLNCREVGDVTIIDLSGKITLGLGAVVLKEGVKRLITQGKRKIILNLAGVTYIDNSGIGELVSCFTSTSHKGGNLKLLSLTKRIKDLLQITKLYTVFEIFDDEAKACASFR